MLLYLLIFLVGVFREVYDLLIRYVTVFKLVFMNQSFHTNTFFQINFALDFLEDHFYFSESSELIHLFSFDESQGIS